MLVVKGQIANARMDESLDRHFGLLIAYILPGFVCLAGASRFSPMLSTWMAVAKSGDPSVGGFLYVIVGSLAAGLVVNAVRWTVLDWLLHQTGVKNPDVDFSQLQEKMDAYLLAVEHNYRHYQFYAGMVFALPFYSFTDQWAAQRFWSPWLLASLIGLEAILILASRDCLRRYYERIRQILHRV